MSFANRNFFALAQSRFPNDLNSVLLETETGQVFTYRQIVDCSARLANALVAVGAKPGDRVAVQAVKSPEALALYLACLRAGIIYLPLNTAYRPAEIEYFLGDAQPSVFVCGDESVQELKTVAQRCSVTTTLTLNGDGSGSVLDLAKSQSNAHEIYHANDDDLAVIIYTSGTTGRSKGAMLTHGNLTSNAQTLVKLWRFTSDDVLLHALPIFHVHGLFVANHCVLISGARMLFHSKFDVAKLIADLPRATVLMGVPTFYTRLLSETTFTRDCAHNVRLFISGSAPLLLETFNAFEARIGQRILERYGMSESGMITSNPLDGEREGGTVGPPLPDVELRIAGDDNKALPQGEIGAIQIRGPNVFKGYWRMPDKTREDFTSDGWFRTGDVGTIGADGYVSIVGRAKDLIISGGYNVYPKEIELILDTLAGVVESAVVGVPHPDFGEAVTAVVVPQKGVTLDEASILSNLKAQLANYKLPKRIYFVADLPRNAMGKVQKATLRQQYAQQ